MLSFQLFCLFIFVSLCTQTISESENRHLNFIWDSLFNFNSKKSDQEPKPVANTICIGCVNKLEEDRRIEDELTALRIEYIKHQILKKLRLKEKPSVTLPIDGLPKPVTEDESLFPRNQDNMAENNDHYYGKTTQAIIFPYEGK